MRLQALVVALLVVTAGPAGALDLKDVTYHTEGAGKVVFSHKTHLKKKNEKSPNVSCKSCHEDPRAPKKKYLMADMEKGKSCGKCHNGKKAFSVSKCTACHKVKDIAFKVKETGPVRFSHERHLKKMQCDACHDRLYSTTGPLRGITMAEMEKGKSCGACHDGRKAFGIDSCDACHPAPKQVVFKVKETGPTVFGHKQHVEMYSCGACHTKLYKLGRSKPVSMAAMEQGKSCGACHNAKEAFALAQCEKCHPAREITFKVAGVGAASFSHKAHLTMYRCNDCHTGTFATDRKGKPVSMSEMQKGKSCGACHDGNAAFAVNGSCDSCHV